MLAVVVALAGMLVAGAFATDLARQWRARRRPHALAWSISLGMYAAGMLALALGALGGFGPATFGTYWLTGPLLSIPYLATGQLHLSAPRLEALWWTLAGLFTVWAVAAMLLSSTETSAFAIASAATEIPRGADVYGGELAYSVLKPVTYTFVVPFLGSLVAAVRSRRWGLAWIAVGVTISALSSAPTRLVDGQLQVVLTSSILALGVAVMYAGFRAAGRRPRAASSAAPAAEAPVDARVA